MVLWFAVFQQDLKKILSLVNEGFIGLSYQQKPCGHASLWWDMLAVHEVWVLLCEKQEPQVLSTHDQEKFRGNAYFEDLLGPFKEP